MGTTLLTKQKVAEAFTTGTLITPSHIAWGTDDTSFSVEDSALGTEVVRASITDTDLQSQTVVFLSTLTTADGNSNTLTEVGLFDAASNGNMFVRDTFAGIAKTNQFEIDTEIVIRVQ